MFKRSLSYLMIAVSLGANALAEPTATSEVNDRAFINQVYNSIPDVVKNLNVPAPYSKEGYRQVRESGGVAQGYWINVDTRDQEACAQVYDSLRNLKTNGQYLNQSDFCKVDQKQPVLSVLVMQDIDSTEFRRNLDLSGLKDTNKNLVTDTRNLAITMVATMGILWTLPGTSTGWDKEKIKNAEGGVFAEYIDNIKKGPVVDRDDWRYNWIGHPISGAAYYTLARHAKLTPMQSFGYSVMMSTFFWEYGFEAFAEIPSIQDLIITPVVGSIMGELLYRAEQEVISKDGKVLGSKALGKLVMTVLNPMGAISNGINSALGTKVVQKAEADLVLRRQNFNGVPANYVGVVMRFSFY